ARASGVRIDLDSSALEIAEPLQAVAAAIGVDPLSYVLTGGEDHALAGTFGPEVALTTRWRRVGRVCEPSGSEGGAEGDLVTVDGVAYTGPTGHDHFH
ncbi:MAG TPA: thiamine-phosphate kinase, partial [Actinopolymorphaceae bacterium]|nr:thiamine-phosphate kinase [Actinopolymorphaceae bacterium]